MGNACCTTDQREESASFKDRPVKEESKHAMSCFPQPNEAVIQVKENEPSPAAKRALNGLQAWNQRENIGTQNNQIGGPFLYLQDGATYNGQFLNGKRSGLGTWIDGNGNYYSGNFVDDKRHGGGREVTANGTIYEGSWFKDSKVSGNCFYPSGAIFKGD
jgi:hypothetical protein